MLLDKDYRALVDLHTLRNTIKASIRSERATYDSVSHRLDLVAELGIPLPSASVLFHAPMDRNWSLEKDEKLALLDRLIEEAGHEINDLFPCEGCGNPVNLLSLAYKAIHRDVVEILGAVLERGADTDCPRLPYSALVMACRSNGHSYDSGTQIPAAKLLLRHGADVHGVGRIASPAPIVEQTPLMYAVGSKNMDLVSLLLEHGADINRGFIAPLSMWPLGMKWIYVFDISTNHPFPLDFLSLTSFLCV